MPAATLAIITSFLISVTTILMKKAIERTNATSAMLMITLVGTIIFLLIALPTLPFYYLKSRAFPYFVLAGIFRKDSSAQRKTPVETDRSSTWADR